MAQTNINIRMDENLKKEFDSFCADIGMSMTTAFTIFVKKTLRENKIPFELSIEQPNNETIEAIREVQRMKADPTLGKTYGDIDLMMKDLLT